MMRKLLVLGTLPPPIGGVTIHVSRLNDLLDRMAINYKFLSLKQPLKIILMNVLAFRVIHLHCSNVYFRFLLSLLCFLLRKKLIVTYHGNIGRYNKTKNWIDYLSIYFSKIPVVMNSGSYNKAYKINRKVRLISSFIPPQKKEKLPVGLDEKVNEWRSKYKLLCSTNAFAVSFDKDNNEIYGIVPLIELFRNRQHECLIISDPSGQYKKYIIHKKIIVPENVVFISYPHSYYALLHKMDCMIRNTTTDGDALSIKEALFLGKIVCATAVVERHYAVRKYNTISELAALLDNIENYPCQCVENLSAEKELLFLYEYFKCYETDNPRP